MKRLELANSVDLNCLPSMSSQYDIARIEHFFHFADVNFVVCFSDNKG